MHFDVVHFHGSRRFGLRRPCPLRGPCPRLRSVSGRVNRDSAERRPAAQKKLTLQYGGTSHHCGQGRGGHHGVCHGVTTHHRSRRHSQTPAELQITQNRTGSWSFSVVRPQHCTRGPCRANARILAERAFTANKQAAGVQQASEIDGWIIAEDRAHFFETRREDSSLALRVLWLVLNDSNLVVLVQDDSFGGAELDRFSHRGRPGHSRGAQSFL